MSNPKPKLTMEDIEKILPDKLDFILLNDSHNHTTSGEPCVTWELQKEGPLKLLKFYCDHKLLEIYNIKSALKRQAKDQIGELFYDHQRQTIYKRTLENYGGYPDLRSFRQAFQDRPETTSEEEGMPF